MKYEKYLEEGYFNKLGFSDMLENGKEKYSIDDVLNSLSLVTLTPKWIPCSERLPKADEYNGDVAKYYLVQNEYGDMLVARYTHGDYWEQIYQLEPIGDEIVAWMPLPEPYEAESEDKE
jgi:hypothetical protein